MKMLHKIDKQKVFQTAFKEWPMLHKFLSLHVYCFTDVSDVQPRMTSEKSVNRNKHVLFNNNKAE